MDNTFKSELRMCGDAHCHLCAFYSMYPIFTISLTDGEPIIHGDIDGMTEENRRDFVLKVMMAKGLVPIDKMMEDEA